MFNLLFLYRYTTNYVIFDDNNLYNKFIIQTPMKIHINDTDLELHYSMRMYIIYENIMGKALSFDNSNSYTSLVVLFYSAIVSTIQKNKLNLIINYDDFMDWIDEHPSSLQEFSEWFAKNISANDELRDITKEEVETDKELGN